MSHARSPLASAFRACRPALVTTAVFSAAINLLTFTGPLYMLSVYDRVIPSRHQGTLLALSLIALAAFVLYGALELVRSRILIRTGVVFDRHLAEPLALRLLAAPGTDRSGQPLRDLDNLRDFLTGAAPIVFCDAPWTPLFVLLAFSLHAWLGWAALAGIAGYAVMALASELATRKPLGTAMEATLAAARISSEAFGRRDVLAAMGMTGRFASRWSAAHDAVVSAQASASDRAAHISALSRSYRVALQSGMLGLGAWLAIHEQISVGAMFAANMLMSRALSPVEHAVQHWKSLVTARATVRRIAAALGAQAEATTPMDLPAPQGTLSVEGLVVRLAPTAKATLAGIGFRLEPGEMLTVVGASGAGKSTLLRTLVKAQSLTAGTVRLDGAALDHYRPEALGKAVGYLPQDIELFAGSVADNIARFGTVEADKVVAAARMAGVHEMILRLPSGYDTDIGPGGSTLSGGQRQRIALARALYDLPALIVLDEPNSNLDLNGEAALAEALRAARAAGSTVVVSSHKPALVDMADKLLVLADGAQQLFGPRQEVLARMTPRAVRAA
ncbi:type I secretion system permease/ATPase [Oryzibacter oryziterrae]|uniref:type I secretion system permease/ATPase n=1 Tax=Oryzibacter oryziterrae TaxID=2766474 RepID=UPI001F01B1C7|nr:type I secretion system permease/ATPase [Oryzibacter oryziterrae]